MYPVEARVTVNAIEIHTRTIGAGPDVVVLHGGPGAHHDYLLPQFDALATSRRLRYYDQRGGGRSAVSRETAVGWREHVADLHALLIHWELEPATLLGFSWGGLLALLYAIQHPHRIARLALVSPAPASASERREFKRRLGERMTQPQIRERRADLVRSGLQQRHPNRYRQRLFELSVAGYFADVGRARDLTPFRITQRTARAVWESLGEYDISKELTTLFRPALVVHGRCDPIPLSAAEQIAHHLQARLEVFEHSGHVPHIEEYDRFVRTLDAFLPRAS